MSLIYHIATRGDWDQARADGQYSTSTLGRSLAEEGFIHCSTQAQLQPVADAFYRGVPDLVLLTIDTGKLTAPLSYDQVPGQPDPFPHIYGPLNLDAVTQTRPFRALPAAGPVRPAGAGRRPCPRCSPTATPSRQRAAHQ